MWLMLSLTLAYLVGSLLYSCIVEPTYIVGRYDLAAWPSLILGVALVVHGAARSVLHGGAGQTAARVVLTALLAACSGITIFGMWATPISNNATARARQIAALVGPDDLVISLGKYRLFMTYEWHHLGFSPRMMSFPTDHERQLCWYDAEAELANPAQIAADALEVSTVIEEALAEGTRVWLLAHGEPAGPRWKVDSQLYTRLRELGIDVQIPDERLGLMMLARTP